MRSFAFPSSSGTGWFRFQIPFVLSLLLGAAPARAQDDPALVENLALLLAMQDARRFDEARISDLFRHPDSLVRRQVAVTAGRLRDPAAVGYLVELLLDPDSVTQQEAAFALGLIGDLSGFARLREFVLNAPIASHGAAHAEAVSAIAKIGGPEAAEFFVELLGRLAGQATSDSVSPALERGLIEAWRLGPGAPLEQIRSFAEQSPQAQVRYAAVYSLARLQAGSMATVILAATDDASPLTRQVAVAALTRAYADSAGLDPGALASRVRRLVDDPDAGVRISALRALGTWADSSLARAAVGRVSDQNPNVRVQALVALGQLGGEDAVRTLRDQADDGIYSLRREALLAAARLPGAGVLELVAPLVADRDWTERFLAAQVLGRLQGDTALAWLEHLSADPDARVAAAALAGAIQVDPEYAGFIARDLVEHADPVVRAVAVRHIGAARDPADLGVLTDAFRRAQSDRLPEVRVAVVEAVGDVAEGGFTGRDLARSTFLAAFPVADDYLVRRAAVEHYPDAAEHWGAVYPLAPRRELGDYRDIVRTLMLPALQRGIRPRVVVETDRGSMRLELYPGEAPLTVHSFLELVDRRYFDNGRWHRVVPNFVIQDGDPRGDGWGGPEFVQRDEISRLRYARGTLGMALSGPDTGGSQFFITVAPQPHLDGTYPVFGAVTEGFNVVDITTQGDRIRRIRRE